VAVRSFSKQRNKRTAAMTRRSEWTAGSKREARRDRVAREPVGKGSAIGSRFGVLREGEGHGDAAPLLAHTHLLDGAAKEGTTGTTAMRTALKDVVESTDEAELEEALHVSGAGLAELITDTLQLQRVEHFAVGSTSDVADVIIVATAKSGRHAGAAARALLQVFELSDDAVDGLDDPESGWIVVELPTAFVHIFASEEVRRQYDLESLVSSRPSLDSLATESAQLAASMATAKATRRRGGEAPRARADDLAMWRDE
jgi:ribosomal silencing factor RsfS